MPKLDISQMAEQAMEQAGITEEQITNAVAEAGGTPAVVNEPLKDEEEEVVEEVEGEEDPEVPEGDKKKPTHVPISRFNKVYREGKELERYLRALVTEREQLLEQLNTRGERPPAVEEPDWDTMTPAQQARVMQEQNRKMIQDELKKLVQTEIRPVADTVAKDRATADMHATAAKYKDYWDYTDTMIEIAERNPRLTAEEVYFIASKNPTKVKDAVTKRIVDKVKAKQKAQVTRTTTAQSATTEARKYRNVKEIGAAVAEKLGM